MQCGNVYAWRFNRMYLGLMYIPYSTQSVHGDCLVELSMSAMFYGCTCGSYTDGMSASGGRVTGILHTDCVQQGTNYTSS